MTSRTVASATNQPPLHQESLRVWLLSAYHTGSHRAWAQGYARFSRHQVELLTMAGRFWKWRMQGGALELAEPSAHPLGAGSAPDLVMATDMVNLPAWLALVRHILPPHTPVLCYMHENQLTYPLRTGEKRDLTYGMLNWLSQVSADTVAFNSHFHRESWFAELPRLLTHFPDFNHLHLVDQIRQQSQVLPVGIDRERLRPTEKAQDTSLAPLILWNQRWEYDKRPDRFFRLLLRLRAEAIPFRLAVAGENFRRAPDEFEAARAQLTQQIVQWGYVRSQADYVRLLQQADLVVSTADHEFYGISILEAICAGAFPLLPNRLSYPELIPAALHPACLYDAGPAGDEVLFQMARHRLAQPRPAPPSLQAHVAGHYGWPEVADRYDTLVEELVAGATGHARR